MTTSRSRRDLVAGIGEQAAYVATDPTHPFYGRVELARRVGFLHALGPMSDDALAAAEHEWQTLSTLPTEFSAVELAAVLGLFDPLPPPLPVDHELERLLAKLDRGPRLTAAELYPVDPDLEHLLAALDHGRPPAPRVFPDHDDTLARLLAQLDRKDGAR